jgi:tRNA(Arg) A34 adenosine deaminase TadA
MVNSLTGKIKARSFTNSDKHPLPHAVISCIYMSIMTDSESIDQHGKSKSDEHNMQYLCSGYDMYVTREPCAM